MSKLADFSNCLHSASSSSSQISTEAYRLAVPTSTEEIEASTSTLPLVTPSVPDMSESTFATAGPASPLVRSHSSQLRQPIIEADDLLWWQAATSDQHARSSIPEVPFRPCEAMSKAARKVHGNTDKGDSAASRMEADLKNLKQIKSFHRRLAKLKGKSREIAEEAELSMSEDDASLSSDLESGNVENQQRELHPLPSVKPASFRKKKRRRPRMHLLDPPAYIDDLHFGPRGSQQALAAFCAALLEQTGFDGDQPSVTSADQ